MRAFAVLAFASFSISTFSLASPLDNQVVLLSDELAEEPRWKYNICGEDENPIVDIQSIVVSPDPPAPGKDLTVKVKAKTSETIKEGAFADVTVKLGLIKLLTKTFDLCEEARNANASVQCPAAPGPYEVEQTVSLPREIPRAKFNVHIDSYSADEEPLFCLDLEADFRWRFPHRW
ncbi:hypothetical protein D9756_003831 [Leucocoprinus leucothites]|uniref:Phosphatidylglycerol/phosphatidylinositol transfer protein n=1 Tax=Leucocoprinus leucothites TaxID=201217 RepID=A0A8H5G0M1_9AGAR|nr:hypothetical protein D9756_003831 [Leucoagaricus leucothites]